MNHALTTNPALTSIDGFDQRDDESSNGGDFIKFDAATQGLWFYRDGSPLSKGPYVAMHCQKELVKWLDKRAVDRIVQTSGEPFPDAAELNAGIPQSEWEEDFNGHPKGPWQLQYTIYLVDPADGSKLICSNSTFGQKLAYEGLKERVQFMRALRGERVFPLIELSSKSMRTRFGTKIRPHFEILEWRNLGGSSGALAIAPAPVDRLPGGPVTKPTASEIVNDRLPWDDDLPANLS
jgi:hypothetical protein